jgi:hypothetical protein
MVTRKEILLPWSKKTSADGNEKGDLVTISQEQGITW